MDERWLVDNKARDIRVPGKVQSIGARIVGEAIIDGMGAMLKVVGANAWASHNQASKNQPHPVTKAARPQAHELASPFSPQTRWLRA